MDERNVVFTKAHFRNILTGIFGQAVALLENIKKGWKSFKRIHSNKYARLYKKYNHVMFSMLQAKQIVREDS